MSSSEDYRDSYGPREELLDTIVCGLRHATGFFSTPGHLIVSEWDLAASGLFLKTPREIRDLRTALNTQAQSLLEDEGEKAAVVRGDLSTNQAKDETGSDCLALIFTPGRFGLVLRHDLKARTFEEQSPEASAQVVRALLDNTPLRAFN